jgi:hypothetical protein
MKVNSAPIFVAVLALLFCLGASKPAMGQDDNTQTSELY